jgi:monooxygenase
MSDIEHFDVLIVGAGLSGIGAACQLSVACPSKSFVILEGRESMGGTWDLFRYPGVRSDSDMYTLGYRFRPWRDAEAIADGAAILSYIKDTAKEFRIDERIRYGHRVTNASWSSEDARWTVKTQTGSAFTCSFLYTCTGYYDYESGYTPEWKGIESFRGQIIHPQKWPEHLDYTNKKVVVIGSGATAVTLVPAMADKAQHVTMLQRSPTYIVSMPTEDAIANFFRRHLADRTAYALTRWKNVMRQMFFYVLSKKRPAMMKRLINKGIRTELGDEYDLKHFTPPYNPWDQRLCLVPDSNLFQVVRAGRASIVTETIDTFTESGVQLNSGESLDADIVVTATGLNLKLMAGLTLKVDGEIVDLSKTVAYKGMMYSDVPNVASAFGYTNASWTLKCDLTAEYVCRILNYMDENGFDRCTPRLNDPSVKKERVLDFTSGYVERALHTLPSQGSKTPWRLHQNYIKDLSMLRYGRVDDGTMEFK